VELGGERGEGGGGGGSVKTRKREVDKLAEKYEGDEIEEGKQ